MITASVEFYGCKTKIISVYASTTAQSLPSTGNYSQL